MNVSGQIDALEQRVAERTVQLGSANELLRREVAERSHVEAELRASEQRFLLASRATNDCIWDWDLIIVAASHLNDAIEAGLKPSPRIRFVPYEGSPDDLFKITR